jgi:hypothetical protein
MARGVEKDDVGGHVSEEAMVPRASGQARNSKTARREAAALRGGQE